MTNEITQADVDVLAAEARASCPDAKKAELDADIKARVSLPLSAQVRFLTGVIHTFESADLAKYAPEVKSTNSDGSRKRPERSNPWSKEGWNISAQGKLVLALGEAKAAAIAQSAGCKIGSTRHNPDYA